MTLTRLGFSLSYVNRGWAVLVFSFSIFCRYTFFSLLVSRFSLFSLCSPFPFCLHLFLSEDLFFPAAFLGFVSTFAAGLADNL